MKKEVDEAKRLGFSHARNQYTTMKNTNQITATNITAESFYNLAQLQRLTGYANPIAAIKATGENWMVDRDASGNIIALAQ
jgi:hypothetical protein